MSIPNKYVLARPIEEWHEDIGDCLWWRFPIEEPPYCGSPLDHDWAEYGYDNYYTHFTEIVIPVLKESEETEFDLGSIHRP